MTEQDAKGPATGPSSSADKHRHFSRDQPVRCAVVTVSDSRTVESDTGGDLIRSLVAGAGHEVVASTIVKDDPDQVTALLAGDWANGAEVILLTGGTGISNRDTTYEAVSALLEKTLPGFGEIFRTLSFEEVGPAAMLSRATAGTHRGRLLFSMPGSPNAVRLAMERLIVPELRHLVWELVRHTR
jgi:molybdopterin adenylyltransferase